MPKIVETIEELSGYFQGVIQRSKHHAKEVSEVIYPLVGVILEKADKGSIKYMVRNGSPCNVLWAKINEKKYVFTYNHEKCVIEMRRSSLQGKTLAELNNKTRINQLVELFLA
jgi:hypothetical protein